MPIKLYDGQRAESSIRARNRISIVRACDFCVFKSKTSMRQFGRDVWYFCVTQFCAIQFGNRFSDMDRFIDYSWIASRGPASRYRNWQDTSRIISWHAVARFAAFHTHLTHCRSAYHSAAASAPWWSHVARKHALEYPADSIRDRRPRRETGKTGTRDRTSAGSSRSSAASCACNSLHHYTRAPTHRSTRLLSLPFLSLSPCLFHHVPPDFLICSRLLASLRRSMFNVD